MQDSVARGKPQECRDRASTYKGALLSDVKLQYRPMCNHVINSTWLHYLPLSCLRQFTWSADPRQTHRGAAHAPLYIYNTSVYIQHLLSIVCKNALRRCVGTRRRSFSSRSPRESCTTTGGEKTLLYSPCEREDGASASCGNTLPWCREKIKITR